MQYKSVVFGPPEEVPAVGSYDTTDVEFIANDQVVHRLNQLARDENWEINLVSLDSLTSGTGFILIQRPGFVPANY